LFAGIPFVYGDSADCGAGRFRALLFAVGVAAVCVGAALTLRPFSSLGALTFFVAASLMLAGNQ